MSDTKINRKGNSINNQQFPQKYYPALSVDKMPLFPFHLSFPLSFHSSFQILSAPSCTHGIFERYPGVEQDQAGAEKPLEMKPLEMEVDVLRQQFILKSKKIQAVERSRVISCTSSTQP